VLLHSRVGRNGGNRRRSSMRRVDAAERSSIGGPRRDQPIRHPLRAMRKRREQTYGLAWPTADVALRNIHALLSLQLLKGGADAARGVGDEAG
jgi:hypothetical protein